MDTGLRVTTTTGPSSSTSLVIKLVYYSTGLLLSLVTHTHWLSQSQSHTDSVTVRSQSHPLGESVTLRSDSHWPHQSLSESVTDALIHDCHWLSDWVGQCESLIVTRESVNVTKTQSC